MSQRYFTSSMKLADLVMRNHNLILTVRHLGIPLGFGDKSVAEVCRQHQLPADFVLLVCNVYTFDDYRPDADLLARTDMSPLLPYLLASHRYYLSDRMPHIAEHVHHVADKIGGRIGEMLKKFFDDYIDEIAEHFRYEEQEAFPALQALLQGKEEAQGSTRRMGEKFAASHGNIEDTLNDLIQIAYKYLPDDLSDNETVNLLMDILQLHSDLKMHEVIEEKVLLPYSAWLENAR